jgi:hypothetical protein
MPDTSQPRTILKLLPPVQAPTGPSFGLCVAGDNVSQKGSFSLYKKEAAMMENTELLVAINNDKSFPANKIRRKIFPTER